MPRQIFDDDEPLLDYGDMDELAELGMGDRGYANPYPPEGSNEIFGDQFERRAREIQRAPANVQPVIIVPQKYGPWSANNQFGIEQAFAGDANNHQSILKLPEWEFPQVWSVMLASNLTETPGADYSVVAVVTAGAGGISDNFEVDWNTGICFSVVTNALNIAAKYEVTTVLPTDLRLRVMVGQQPMNGTAPTRTVRGTCAAGGLTVFAIPKYAKSVTILPGPPPNNDVYAAFANYQLTTSNLGGFAVNVSGTQLLSLGNGGQIVIPGTANFFSVDNNTASDIDFVAIFQLGL
jgi:hypothetical protein